MSNPTKAERLRILNEPDTPEVHTDTELESKALNFIKRCKPKEFKKMSKKDLNEYCQLKARAARREAENLMATGEPDFIAWNRAIRSVILESESD